jgi:hypothetical protein
MTAPNPIPAGPHLDAERESKKPDGPPQFPAAWTATVLLSPFGDSVSPLPNSSQLVAATIESSSAATENWMRVVLYLTQDQRCYEFVFRTVHPDKPVEDRYWYWVDSSPKGSISNIYGPFPTTLRVPGPRFFANALWGNSYPLMCTDKNKKGIECDHWLLPSPGPPGHGSWCSFRKDTGQLFRVLMVDSTNPLMLPILGSYFIANLPTVTNGVSDNTKSVIQSIKRGVSKARPEYWNPMVTQEDIHRAMAFPLASAACATSDVEAVIPGFTVAQSSAGLPRWSDKTYAQGWSIGADFVPYFTRVCYIWTGGAASKQQTVFIGVGAVPDRPYSTRTDTCLNKNGTVQPHYEWQTGTNTWAFRGCLTPNPPVGVPYPDWLARDGALIMGRIRGNSQFGLEADQTLNLIAAQAPRGGGELAIFWLWFLEDGSGMLFTEANYMNPLSHNLQLIDYNIFIRNAGLTQKDFSNPCGWPKKVGPKVGSAHGHFTQIGGRMIGRHLVRYFT